VQISTSEQERLLFWARPKAAFPRWGGISPDFSVWTAPFRAARCRKPWRESEPVGKIRPRRRQCVHAGDGNCIPLILYDANKPGEMDKAEAFGADILRCCVELGAC